MSEKETTRILQIINKNLKNTIEANEWLKTLPERDIYKVFIQQEFITIIYWKTIKQTTEAPD